MYMTAASSHSLRAVACAAALLLSTRAAAVNFDGTVTTYLSVSQTQQPGELGANQNQTQVPGYEFVTMRANQIQTAQGELSIVVSGWGSFDLEGHRTYLGEGGDLNLAYVSGSMFKNKLTFRVGRQMIVDGTARMQQVDGANIRYVFGAGVGVEAWAGATVVPRLQTALGDFAYGGRVFWRPNFETELGASYTQVNGVPEGGVPTIAGMIARQEVGVDGRIHVLKTLTLTGAAVYDPTEQRFAQIHADVSWQIVRGLAVTARWERTAPDLFVPQNTIWSVFTDNEQRDQVGGAVSWSPGQHVSLYGEYFQIFSLDGNGYQTSGRITWSPRFFTLGAEVRALRYQDPLSFLENGNITPRLYVLWRPGSTLTLSADVQESELLQPVNGQTHSWNAGGSIGWAFVPGWRLVLGLLGGVTPFLTQDVQLMGKIEWNPSFHVAEAKP
jgi:hypothetical protein